MSAYKKQETKYEIKRGNKHETKVCPRCAGEFECKSGSILLCQCQTIYLTDEQMDYLNAQYDGCLCISCLSEVRREHSVQQHEKAISKFSR